MRKRRRLIAIASILLISEIIENVIAIQHLGGSLRTTDLIHFFLTCILALNLVRGKEWARIVIALLCFLAAAFAATVPFILKFNDTSLAGHPLFFTGAAMCVVYLFTSVYLFASPGVSREIHRANR